MLNYPQVWVFTNTNHTFIKNTAVERKHLDYHGERERFLGSWRSFGIRPFVGAASSSRVFAVRKTGSCEVALSETSSATTSEIGIMGSLFGYGDSEDAVFQFLSHY